MYVIDESSDDDDQHGQQKQPGGAQAVAWWNIQWKNLHLCEMRDEDHGPFLGKRTFMAWGRFSKVIMLNKGKLEGPYGRVVFPYPRVYTSDMGNRHGIKQLKG